MDNQLDTLRSIESVSNIQNIIETCLNSFSQFQTEEGLFKTFRVDYSKEECPNNYINEDNAVFIDTKYDHSFILEILLRLRNYFTDKKNFLNLHVKGLQLIINDAIVTDFNGYKTLQWRYYNIDHQGTGKILSDIDDTGRCLILIQRLRDLYEDKFLSKFTHLHSIENSEHTYRQFWSCLYPMNSNFRPSSDNTGKYHGLLTYFGDKTDNDIDPSCNIMAIYCSLSYFNKNPTHITPLDLKSVKSVLQYLEKFLHSEQNLLAHEYYEPMFVFYNYAKLISLWENLRPELKILIPIGNMKQRLTDILTSIRKHFNVNPLETAFFVSSLMILGYKGHEIEDGINYIVDKRYDNHWKAYRFYRQRHPHRIFGSRGLTSTVCLEALNYFIQYSKLFSFKA